MKVSATSVCDSIIKYSAFFIWKKEVILSNTFACFCVTDFLEQHKTRSSSHFFRSIYRLMFTSFHTFTARSFFANVSEFYLENELKSCEQVYNQHKRGFQIDEPRLS